jgi:hypothetical protein
MAVISIEYNDGNKQNLGYKSVKISYDNLRKEKIFNSGNFVKDWFDCNKFITQELSDLEFHFSNSSSVDHFIMNGAPYHSVYLVFDENDKCELHYGNEWYNNGIEFFVPAFIKPTWNELKEMCK